MLVGVACVCGVAWLGVGGAQWLVCFLFYFFCCPRVFRGLSAAGGGVLCLRSRLVAVSVWRSVAGVDAVWCSCPRHGRSVLAVGGYGILLFSRSACMSAFMWLLRIMQ